MVSTRPLIFKSSSPFNNPLATIPKAPITIGITVTFMFLFFQFPSEFQLLIFLFAFFQFYSMISRESKFSFFCWSLSGLVVWSRLGDLFVSQNPRGVCASHFPGQMLGCAIYHLFVCYYYYSLIRAFHICVSRWFFTGVWVTASLLKSPGLFSVFRPFSIMLSFGWFPLVHQLPSPLAPLVIL